MTFRRQSSAVGQNLQPYHDPSLSVARTNDAAAAERGRISHRNGFTYDSIPEYASSGSPSSVGVTLNAANIPTIFNHTRARKRPGHCRAPNPNARFGKAGASGESHRSGWNRSGSANTAGSCITPHAFGITIDPAGMK